jgi:hypothetical protein
VTTIAGTATSSGEFTYRAAASTPTTTPVLTPAPLSTAPVTCAAPSVKEMKLKAARQTIKAAHCALGKNIRKPGADNRNGKVVAQAARPGTRGPYEFVIRVTLGKR